MPAQIPMTGSMQMIVPITNGSMGLTSIPDIILYVSFYVNTSTACIFTAFWKCTGNVNGLYSNCKCVKGLFLAIMRCFLGVLLLNCYVIVNAL